MRIGIAQINTVPGAFDATVERMVAQSQRAAEQNVDLLLFPLAALAGVDVLPFADTPSFMRDIAEAMVSLSERVACPCIVPVPMAYAGEEAEFDAVLLDGGDMRPLCLMSHLRPEDTHEVRDDHEVPQFEFSGERVSIALSYESLDALDDYEYEGNVTLFFSGYPFAMDDISSAMAADLENARFVSDAQTMGSWLVGVAPVGGYGDQVFTGSSFVMDPSGKLIALAPAFEEALLVADVGTEDGDGDATRLGPLVPEVYDAPFHLWQALTLGIHDFVAKQGYTDVALCLDGTLGASVLLALASDAVGPLHVHALIGASAGSAAPGCRDLAHRLRVNQVDATGHPREYDVRDLDELELAAMARECGALALSSVDKTLLSLGAQAGHVSCAMLCPLGDVYRSDVLDMAHVRNTISPIFRKVDLTEADAIALTYADGMLHILVGESDITRVDEILLAYIEYDRSYAEIASEGTAEEDLIDAVLRAEHTAELFRRSCPPVLTMSTHTLDDARFPLGVSWHDRHLDAQPVQFGSMNPLANDEVVDIPPTHPSENDLDATLAMLRDLAEQGGFFPTNATPFDPTKLADQFKEGTLSGFDPLAWMNPFSEN